MMSHGRVEGNATYLVQVPILCLVVVNLLREGSRARNNVFLVIVVGTPVLLFIVSGMPSLAAVVTLSFTAMGDFIQQWILIAVQMTMIHDVCRQDRFLWCK